MTHLIRAAVVVGALATCAAAQTPQALEILHVRGNIYVLFGAGGNITLSVGPDGVLMVDSGDADKARLVLAAIEQLQRQREFAADRGGLGWGAETRSTCCCRTRSSWTARSQSATSSTRTRIRIMSAATRTLLRLAARSLAATLPVISGTPRWARRSSRTKTWRSGCEHRPPAGQPFRFARSRPRRTTATECGSATSSTAKASRSCIDLRRTPTATAS